MIKLVSLAPINEGWLGQKLAKGVNTKKLVDLLTKNGLKQSQASTGPYSGDFWIEKDTIWYNSENEKKINSILLGSHGR